MLGVLAGTRMLGLFLDDWRTMSLARRARGVGDRGVLRRFVTMSFVLLVFAVRRGTKLALAMEAHERLVSEGVRSRLVNMASMRLFEQQDADYRESVLPPSCSTRLAVEAGVSFGWERWTGDGGQVIGVDHFGASAPAGVLFEQFGFTADAVYARAKALLA